MIYIAPKSEWTESGRVEQNQGTLVLRGGIFFDSHCMLFYLEYDVISVVTVWPVQVIALVHTLLKCSTMSLKHCLVLAPLNAVLNWVFEWQKWLDKRNQLKVVTSQSSASDRDNEYLVVPPLHEVWPDACASVRGTHASWRLLTLWRRVRSKTTP